MTRSEQKKWLGYFRQNTAKLIEQLEWVSEEGISLKVLANRISAIGLPTIPLHYLMPTGLKDAINKKYPGRMERL
jgi:hypothetical protein